MDTTEHDLRLLSIGYYIQGGILMFYALLALFYLTFMGAILSQVINAAEKDGRNQIPPGVVEGILTVFGVVVVIIIAGSLCLLYSGLALRNHKHRTFVLVMAALSCLAIPYGTLLGIFTFMVLQRPAAKVMFGQMPMQPPPLPQLL